MTTAAKLSYAQRFNTMNKRGMIMTLMELVEIIKLTLLITEKTVSIFMVDWKSLVDFCMKQKEKNALMTYVLKIRKKG